MSQVLDNQVAEGTDDSADLADFGYRQQLRRGLGSFSAFAAGFSFVSILTTVFQLFAFGYSFGGPAFFWTWPLVFAGQLLVALNFAELAAHYPIAGSVYQWGRQLSRGFAGWVAGWMMLVGAIVSVSAAAIALQVVLPLVWSGFQVVGGDPSLTTASGATNAVVLGAILIAATTLANVLGVKVMAAVNDVGVCAELIGVALLVALLAFHGVRGPQVVFRLPHPVGHHPGSYLWPFLVSALMAAYVMYGFDTAGSLAEETVRPRRVAPRAILRALAASGLGGALLLVTALMAAPSLTSSRLSTEGLPYVLTSALGSGLGRILLADVAVAITVATLAIQTAATRLAFSMARDGALPFSARMGQVSRRTRTPVLPAVVVGVVALAILVVNIGQAQLFAVITSVAVVVVYLAYLLVTVPLLVRRCQGWPGPRDPTLTGRGRLFCLGRWGVPANVAAVLYGAVMVVNIAWPRGAVYDPGGSGHWYLRYFAEILVGATVAVSGLCYLRQRRATPASGSPRLHTAEISPKSPSRTVQVVPGQPVPVREGKRSCP